MNRVVGLEASQRYRCDACGNLTRFDIETVERVRRFWHQDLAGGGVAEQTEVVESRVDAVTCRWCGSHDAVRVVDTPHASSAP